MLYKQRKNCHNVRVSLSSGEVPIAGRVTERGEAMTDISPQQKQPGGDEGDGLGRPFAKDDVLRLASGAYFWPPYSRWIWPTTSRTARCSLTLMAQVPPTPWLTVRVQPAGNSLSPERPA